MVLLSQSEAGFLYPYHKYIIELFDTEKPNH
jgi:hypothetical protein